MENNIDENIDQTIVQNLDVGNTITACVALKESADLLKDDEKEISDMILLIAKTLLERAMVQEVEVEKAKTIVDSLKND